MGENDYKIIKLLGAGSYGSVYLAKSKSSNNESEYVAIKKFHMNDKKAYMSFKNEIKIFKKIKSDYLVKILDYYRDSKYMYLVMEYAEKGDLEEYIRSAYKKNNKIDTKFIDTVIYQITEGLNVLHKSNIIHRDIKSSNILVFNNNLVKITDFGVSKMLENNNLLANTSIGTPYYMSPELINGTPYNFSVDFWAFGCLIYKMLTNKYPFEASNMSALFYKIIKGNYNLKNIPFKYKNIVSKLLNDKFKRADEKELYDFILSNSNAFLRLDRIKKVDTISPIYLNNQDVKEKIYPVYQKLDLINHKYKNKLKEINQVYNKNPYAKKDNYKKSNLQNLNPIDHKDKLKEINQVYNKNPYAKKDNYKKSNLQNLNPINHKINQNYDIYNNKSNLPKIYPINNSKNTRPSNNIYNVNKRYNMLEPIDVQNRYRKKYKKDFIKINIQNIKKIERNKY